MANLPTMYLVCLCVHLDACRVQAYLPMSSIIDFKLNVLHLSMAMSQVIQYVLKSVLGLTTLPTVQSAALQLSYQVIECVVWIVIVVDGLINLHKLVPGTPQVAKTLPSLMRLIVDVLFLLSVLDLLILFLVIARQYAIQIQHFTTSAILALKIVY